MNCLEFLIQNKYSLLKDKKKSKIPIMYDWPNGDSLTYEESKNAIDTGLNLSVRTGARSNIEKGFGLIVIDFDIRTKNVALTNEAVRYLKKLLGELSQHVIVISGSHSGSAHIYLKCPLNEIPKSKYIINGADWSIMLCADGKKVTVPPSIHPETNKPYQWKTSPEDSKLIDVRTLPIWGIIKSKKEVEVEYERTEIQETIDCVDDLPVSQNVKTLIKNGDINEQYPSRSEAIYAVIHALVAMNINTDNIVNILTDSENMISEGVLERAKGDIESAANWIMPQIKKASDTQIKQIMDMFDEEAPPAGDQAPGALQFGGLEPGVLDDFDSIALPRTEWVIPGRLAAKFITLTVAPGGSGKSTLTMQEAVSVASGINCCGMSDMIEAPVWVFNNEDPMDELKRRVSAICAHFNVPRERVLKNFRINSGRYKSGRLILAKDSNKKGPYLYDSVLDILEDGIKKYGFKLLVIDPFARSHYLNENDNSAIDMLADALNLLADKTDCAINLVHHCRKLSSGEINAGSADSIRGASSLVNSARIAHTLTTMSKSDAEKLGIEENKAAFYSRLDSAKNNLSAPQDHVIWYKKESVMIPNGEKRGVLSPWSPPTQKKLEEDSALNNAIKNEIKDAWDNNKPLKLGRNSPDSVYSVLEKPPFSLTKDNAKKIIEYMMNSRQIAYDVLKGSIKGIRVL